MLTGYHQSHNAEDALFKLIQTFQSELDMSRFVTTILLDLSQTYKCLSQDFITSKLKIYGSNDMNTDTHPLD